MHLNAFLYHIGNTPFLLSIFGFKIYWLSDIVAFRILDFQVQIHHHFNNKYRDYCACMVSLGDEKVS